MNRKIFNLTLGEALSLAILFALVVAVITNLPYGGFWVILKIVLLMFLVLLNVFIIVGFTSFQNNSTKNFYTFAIPIYPLYLIGEELIRRWELTHLILMLTSYGVCVFILVYCFKNSKFTRLIESIVIVLFVFSSPYFYNAIF